MWDKRYDWSALNMSSHPEKFSVARMDEKTVVKHVEHIPSAQGVIESSWDALMSPFIPVNVKTSSFQDQVSRRA